MRVAIGLTIGGVSGAAGGVPITPIFADDNIVITFSEEVQPATVTNVGDGTGSFELYNDTDAAWVAGALSTSDNIQWTFNPTVDFTVGDSLTLHLKATILTVVGSNPYEGPFEFKYKVAAKPPLAPTLDSVTPGDTQNTIAFTDNDTSDSFNINWGTTTGVLTNTIVGVTSPYDHTGLTNGTEYFYEVVAIKGGVESSSSAEDSGTPSVVTGILVIHDTFDGSGAVAGTLPNTVNNGNFWDDNFWDTRGNVLESSGYANQTSIYPNVMLGIDSGSNDHRIEATVRQAPGETIFDPLVATRVISSGSGSDTLPATMVYMYAEHDSGSDNIHLIERSAGGTIQEVLGTYDVPEDTDYIISVEVKGTAATVKINGTVVAVATLTTVLTGSNATTMIKSDNVSAVAVRCGDAKIYTV